MKHAAVWMGNTLAVVINDETTLELEESQALIQCEPRGLSIALSPPEALDLARYIYRRYAHLRRQPEFSLTKKRISP